jgi:hypothetical protein
MSKYESCDGCFDIVEYKDLRVCDGCQDWLCFECWDDDKDHCPICERTRTIVEEGIDDDRS